MHHAPRSSLPLLAVASLAMVGLAACRTHDRRIYSTHRDRNLHVTSPWAATPAKAADDATANVIAPVSPVAPVAPPVPPPAQ